GQITLLAKHFRSAEWTSLSVPRNRSAQFNEFLAAQQASGREKIDRHEAPLEFAADGTDDG
ncbi:MAG: DUF1572 domain-containing protein, partial [Pyrinomonadaceae bacterium]|nr:DUF1572 domain-containing protein [Pyrinomonadaceae bacterium]